MADWKGPAFLALLRSAERARDRAMRLGSFQVKTPSSRARAWLVFVTYADQRLGFFVDLGLVFVGITSDNEQWLEIV